MNIPLKRILFICCFISVIFNSAAQPLKTLLTNQSPALVVGNVSLFADNSCSISFAQISSAKFADKFSLLSKNNAAFKDDKPFYWLKFQLLNRTTENNSWLLNFDQWQLVDCYVVDSAGHYKKLQTGKYLPFKQRDYQVANRSFIEMNLKSGEGVTCYTRLYAGFDGITKPDDFSLKIYPKSVFEKEEDFRLNLVYFFSGIYFVMLFYNLFIYFSTRERSYLFYLGILFLLLYAVLDNSGYAAQLFKGITAYPLWFGRIDIAASFVIATLVLEFTRDFLKINSTLPLFGKLFNILICLLFLLALPGFFGHQFFANTASSILGLVVIVLVSIATIKSYQKKSPSSGLFLIAFGIFILGSAIFLLKEIGVLPLNTFTENSLQVGSSIETILFSLALANRINILKKQNEANQLEIIRQLNNNSLLQTKINRELEEKVEERTMELRESQKQLLQKEKLAALGEVVAGVAHEIQNPLNFVKNFSEINIDLLSELEEEISNGNHSEAKGLRESIRTNTEKIMHHGQRADAIVKGMLQHSRSSSGSSEMVNINTLVDDYLNLSYHALVAKESTFKTNVKRDYDEDIEPVKLIQHDIGRVLLNIFNNAFYAVTEKQKLQGEGYSAEISASTKKLDGTIEIQITDNGTGIPPAILNKIFQPFFTTKPTGVGVGLGLSQSYDIIKEHGGELNVITDEGFFTTFIILLPQNSTNI